MTPHESAIAQRYYGRVPLGELARTLDRSATAIRQHVNRVRGEV